RRDQQPPDRRAARHQRDDRAPPPDLDLRQARGPRPARAAALLLPPEDRHTAVALISNLSLPLQRPLLRTRPGAVLVSPRARHPPPCPLRAGLIPPAPSPPRTPLKNMGGGPSQDGSSRALRWTGIRVDTDSRSGHPRGEPPGTEGRPLAV